MDEDTPQRLNRVSRLEELGPEIETLFAKGLTQPPLVMGHRVDPVVRLLRAGNNVALVGPSGAGKRSIAYGLRRSEEWRDAPQMTLEFEESAAHPASWPVYRTTVRHWMDGVIYMGNLENKVSLICRRAHEDAIVLLEAAHTAIGAWKGRGESLDLVDLLCDVAAHPKIHMVITVTPGGWAQLAHKKPEFTEQFVVVDVEAPDEADTKMVLAFGLGNRVIPESAIDEALRLSARHFPALPPLGPSVRVLRAAVPDRHGTVDVAAVRDACARELGIRRRWVGTDQVPQSATILAELETEVVGQRHACEAIADDLGAFAQGLTPPGRPLGYVLVGTPGTGKTSLAGAVQRLIGGEESEPLRYDCSEYGTPLDVLRLLSNDSNSLITGLSNRPGSVLLFDEVDRMASSGRDLLYQLLGEGRLTSLNGETVSCANCIVMMTTNFGSSGLLRAGTDEVALAKATAAARGACVELLGPAIASRVTRTLVFPPLAIEHTAAIVRTELERVTSSPGLEERGILISAAEELVASLAFIGLSSTNGARGIHKIVHEVVTVPLARFLSEHPQIQGVLTVEPMREGGVLEGVRISLLEPSVFPESKSEVEGEQAAEAVPPDRTMLN